MNTAGFIKIDSFFKSAAGVGIERQDLGTCSSLLQLKLDDLVVRAETCARASYRDRIAESDLELSSLLIGCISAFERIDNQLEVRTLLGYLAGLPRADLDVSEAASERLPDVVGGLAVALARALRIVDPELRAPRHMRWHLARDLIEILVTPAPAVPAITSRASGGRFELQAFKVWPLKAANTNNERRDYGTARASSR